MLTRRATLQAAALLPASALAQPAIVRPRRESTLRIVPGSGLTALDPIWTPLGVTTGHAYHLFDTLYAVNKALVAKPQMAAGHTQADDFRDWTITLRPGLRFHDGTPVLARDAVASIRRWGRRDSFGSSLLAVAASIDAVDDQTIHIRCTRPFPHLLDALAHPVAVACFIMPERLAQTDPQRQVTDMVGSGPYRFLADEFVPGSAAAYARFDGYVPRDEPADYASGGKRAGFERIEWHTIPDAATAAAALRTGEVDWWELAQSDLVPTLRASPGVRVIDADPFLSFLRFNCAQPPFDKPALRHAVLGAVEQADYMSVITNTDEHAWRTCYATMGCGLPHVRELGAPSMTPPRDLAAARAAVAAAGYGGERVVILSPSDQASMAPHGEITAALLRRLGMTVDLQVMDLGTLGQRRVSREPVERGGWSIFHNNTPGIAISNPALDFLIRGQGANGYFGWYASPEMERIAADWTFATSPDDEDRLFNAAQMLAFAEAPTIPLGMYDVRTAYRADLTGLIPASVLYPWNVRRA